MSEPAKKRRHKKIREVSVHHDDGEGNWLVSYADMMTLLFGFFVLIASFSTPDPAKVEQVKQSTSESMGGKYEQPYEQMTGSIKKMLTEIKVDKDVAIEQTEAGVTIVSRGTLFFDSGSAVLRTQARELMEQIVGILSVQAREYRIVLE